MDLTGRSPTSVNPKSMPLVSKIQFTDFLQPCYCFNIPMVQPCLFVVQASPFAIRSQTSCLMATLLRPATSQPVAGSAEPKTRKIKMAKSSKPMVSTLVPEIMHTPAGVSCSLGFVADKERVGSLERGPPRPVCWAPFLQNPSMSSRSLM